MTTASIFIASHRSRVRKACRVTSLALLGSAAFLWLAAVPVNAQIIVNPDPLSDRVSIVVNGLLPPLVDFSIKESQEGILYTIPVPRTIIELTEPGATGGNIISDRLIIDPYEILFQSDPFGTVGTPGRTIDGVVEVPEIFSPISLRFGSDVENTTSGVSDFVDLFLGGSATPHHFDIPEPIPPGPTEPPLTVSVGPLYFDMMEDDGTLSDTLDIPQFSFSFVSDGEDIGLPVLDPLPGDRFFSFPEAGLDGTGLIFGYDVRAFSDAEVPEPASMALAALALVGLTGLVRRR